MSKLIKSILFGLSVALGCSTANADTFGVHLYTEHASGQFCDSTPGLYYVADNGFTVGAYRNSECTRISTYVAKTWSTDGNVGASLTAGVATGYNRLTFTPMLVPSAYVKMFDKTTKARVSLLPDYIDNQIRYRNVHVSVEHQF